MIFWPAEVHQPCKIFRMIEFCQISICIFFNYLIFNFTIQPSLAAVSYYGLRWVVVHSLILIYNHMVERDTFFIFQNIHAVSNRLPTHVNNPNWQEDLSSNVDCIYSPAALNICTAAPRCSGVRIKAAAATVQTRTCGKLQRTSFGSCRRVLQTTRRSHTHPFVHKRDIPGVKQPLCSGASR